MNDRELDALLRETLSRPEEPCTELTARTMAAVSAGPKGRYVNLWPLMFLASLAFTFFSSLLLLCFMPLLPGLGIAAVVHFSLTLAVTIFLFVFSLKHENITKGAIVKL
jgi:hypothetical protein